LPRALEAREVLPDQLRARGAVVDVIPAYQTVLDDGEAESLRAQLRDGEVDVLTFTSSSTVRNFAQALTGGDLAALKSLVGSALVAAIGPITADTARELGLEPQILAEEHTIPGLIRALETHFFDIRSEIRHSASPDKEKT